MAWITPIIDRTLSDVQYAIANQNDVSNLKGAFNIYDIDRIINNVEHLKILLNEYGYFPVITPLPSLSEGDLPYLSTVIDVLRTNVENVVESFYQLNNPTIRYGNVFDYNDANSLEINLKITNDLFASMIASIKYAGTFYAGEVDVI